ncbi:MAG TPA: RsmE family RNA methyltransferase [Verrucomicrobiae bacterium]|nr:RsmE family RNA methyltransferase [Verrucomicrobiae bacterium]
MFSADANADAREIVLEGREAHHAGHVLRIRPGEEVAVLDGKGGEYVCLVLDVRRHSLRVEVKDRKMAEHAPYEVTLFQALPKGKAFETILRKATELGAYRVVPLLTERVVTRAEKHEKWQWVMIDAMKQCGNPWMPLLDAPEKLVGAMRRTKEFDLNLVGSLHEGRRHPREWLDGKRFKRVSIWVGPEGDFTPAELEALEKASVKPMSLGRLVLRSDTAAISSLAIINHELEFACIATKKS